jgi:hypothetical protein
MEERTMSYNGWSNYETWNVKLWLDNEQNSAYAMEELAAIHRDNVYELAGQIKDYVECDMPDMEASLWSDLLRSAFDEVDWREIARAYIEDLPDEDEEDEEDEA